MHVSAKLLLFFIAAFITGCTEPTAEPLRVVSSPWPGYEPIYLARDLGYLHEEQIKISELPSSNITLESFRNGSADVATLTLNEALTSMASGHQLRILLALDIAKDADAVLAKPEIKKLSDLKGKRIGIENISLGVYMLNRLLDRAMLKPSDVQVIPIPEDKQEKMFVQNEVDAVITFEPFKSRLLKAGAHVVFDPKRASSEIYDVLVVHAEVYDARRDELCELGRQWFRTLDYIMANPKEAAKHMGKRLGADAAEYRAMMRGLHIPSRTENERLLSGNNPAILAAARRLANTMLYEHLLPTAVNPAQLLAPEFQECLKS